MAALGLAMGLPFLWRSAAPTGFNFQQFFAGRAGTAYLYGLPGYSTAYTTDVGSTEAVAAYDPVGRVTDLSGNGNHWTQSVSAARPWLDTVYPYTTPLLKSDPNALKYLEASVPELNDTDGYTMIVVGISNDDMWTSNRCGMARATTSAAFFAPGAEGVYSNAGGMRGVSWYYEQSIASVHNSGKTVLISEFQRRDRNTFRTIASNDVLAPSWTDAGDKAATLAYGYDAEFRTMGPDGSAGHYFSVCHMAIEGFLSDDERAELYTFFASLKDAIA